MAAYQGNFELAEQSLLEAVRVGRETGNKVILCFALSVLSVSVELPRGDIEAARTHLEAGDRFAQDIGLDWAVAQSKLGWIHIATSQGQWSEARAHALEALEVFRELRDTLMINMTYGELGDIELNAGSLPDAQRYHQQCIIGLRELGQRALVVHELESFAFIAHRRNRPEPAARLLGAAEALREQIGVSLFGIQRLNDKYESSVAWLHTQLDETAFHAHWEEGRAMSMDEAISYALEE
jgi:hypothetical protein